MPRPVSNPPNPWESLHAEWLGEPPAAELEIFEEESRSIIAENDSPDVGFRYSVNPYRGCFHACAYCYARRPHSGAGRAQVLLRDGCHLAYEVTAAEAPDAGTRAVTLRTWFDPSTIASFRGNGPLTPNPRTVYMLDEAGRRYDPSPRATQAWENVHGKSTPLERELRPGESYTTTFVIELPADARAPRLFVGDPPGGIERVLVGHENSPMHGRTYLALPPVGQSAAQR